MSESHRSPFGHLMNAAAGVFVDGYAGRAHELAAAAISYAESLGYEKPEPEEEPETKSYDLVDAFPDGYLWQCKECGRRLVGDRRNNIPDHDCAEAGHWTTPPYRKPIDWTRQ